MQAQNFNQAPKKQLSQKQVESFSIGSPESNDDKLSKDKP
jgi:hypothetical protein